MKKTLIIRGGRSRAGRLRLKTDTPSTARSKEPTAWFTCFDRTRWPFIDSAAVTNGVFRFEGVAEKPQTAILRDARDDGATFGAMLILEPGTINVTDDAQNPYRKKVTGTPANDASDAYATAGSALVQEFRNPETTAERREAIEQEYEQLTRTVLDQNRDNLFGVMLLSQQLGYELSGQELLDEIAKFPAEMQQTDALMRLKENAEQKMKTDIGQPFIDIAQPNADGEQVSLESVVRNPANKYVLLDFWASWCSQRGLPDRNRGQRGDERLQRTDVQHQRSLRRHRIGG